VTVDQSQSPHDPGLVPPRPWLTRVGVRLAVGGALLAVLAVPFSLILLLVEDKWDPLVDLDTQARDSLHSYALAHPGFATTMRVFSDLGSAVAWQVITVAIVVWLLAWRRRPALAVFVVVTIAGSSLLNSLVKVAVNRARPVVPEPLLHEPGMSFPSGHAQAAMVGYTVILILFLPMLTGGWRRVLVGAAVFMVLAIGFSRVALAAHYVSDVLAGFVLGLAWVVLTVTILDPRREPRREPRR